MLIKHKSALVIAISSLVIASVLVLTIFGFYAYLEWKKKDTERNYRIALYDFNGRLFAKHIIINLRTKIARTGVFKGKPIVEGSIKNASNKKIYSLKLRIAFCDSLKQALYVDIFYPVGLEFDSFVNIGNVTKNFLGEGDSISFKHQLKNCPPEVTAYLKSKLKFAKAEYGQPLELTYKIGGLDIR